MSKARQKNVSDGLLLWVKKHQVFGGFLKGLFQESFKPVV